VDLPGAFLTAAGITALIFFLSFSGWYYLAACAAALGLLVFRILRVREPFIDPALFRNVRFRAGMIAGFLIFASSIGIIFIVPLMFSAVHRLDTRQIGLLMFPGAISGVFFGRLGGSLADKRGNGLVVGIGLLLLVLSLLALSFLMGSSPWAISAALLFTYIGFTLIQTGLINSVSQTLPMRQTGVGMGLFNLITFISAAIGTALVGKILASGWLDRKLYPLVLGSRTFAYSNLVALFAFLVATGGVIYFLRFGRRRGG
jgi:DHA2 family metal-tetracycline-proton antiporter-like MFS transporter